MRTPRNAALIAELNGLVAQHNETSPQRVKLGELLKVYERGYRGASPAARALAKVEAHLEALAKADTFSEGEHPRGKGGEFKSKGAANPPSPWGRMPANQAEHQEAQRANAGYRAITSDVIPENRYEAAGAVIRDGASLAAGAMTVSALARNRPGKGIEQAVGRVGGAVVGTAAAAAGRVAGTGAYRVARAGHDYLGMKKPVRQHMVDPLVRSGRAAGTKVGDAALRYPTRAAGTLVQAALKNAGVGTATGEARTRARAAMREHLARGAAGKDAVQAGRTAARRVLLRAKLGRRGALFAGLAGVTGLMLRHQVAGSIFDPAAIGHSIDSFSYRTVEKAAGLDALDALRAEMAAGLAKVDGSADGLKTWLDDGHGAAELRKGVWSKVARGLFSAAGAAVAGAAGAAAGHAVGHAASKGNPYHDKGGRFTSAANAAPGENSVVRTATVAGGVLAGVASGAAIAAALHHHNQKAVLRNFGTLFASWQKVHARIAADTTPLLRQAVRSKPDRIKAILTQHRALGEHRDQIKELAEHGASAASALRAKVLDLGHRDVAAMLERHPSVRVPGSPKGTWVAAKNEDAIHAALNHPEFGSKDFAEMTAGLKQANPEVHDQVHAMFATTRANAANVEQQIAGHKAKITAAEAAERNAATQVGTTKLKHEAAEAKVVAVPDAEKEAAKTAAAEALAVHAAADDAHEHTKTVLKHLRENPQGVVDHKGRPVAPPTDAQLEASKAQVHESAAKAAEKVWQKEFATLKASETARTVEREHRSIAAYSVVANSAGGPRGARTQNKALSRLWAGAKAAEAVRAEAHAAHQRNVPEFKELGRLDRFKGQGAPNGMTGQRAADLRRRGPDIRAAYDGTAMRLDEAETAVLARHAEVRAADTVLRQALDRQAPVPGAKRQLIPGPLKVELRRAQAAATGPVKALIDHPTTARLAEFAGFVRAKKGKDGKVITPGRNPISAGWNKGKKAARDGYEELFTVPDEQAAGKRRISVPKVLRNVGIATGVLEAGAATAVAAKEFLAGGPEGRKRALADRTRFHIESDGYDPITGAGYIGLSIPHPTDPNDRTLIWGDRSDGEKKREGALHAGARVSEVRARMRAHTEQIRRNHDQAQGGGGGDQFPQNPGLQFDGNKGETVKAARKAAKGAQKIDALRVGQGPEVRVRQDGATEGNDGAHEVYNTVLRKMPKGNGAASPEQAHEVMGALFSPHSDLLTLRQVNGILTGRDGSKTFPRHLLKHVHAAGAEASAADLETALGKDVDALKPTKDQHLRGANLQRAVLAVGKAHGLSNEAIGRLQQRVRDAHGPAAAPAAAPTPAAAPSTSTAVATLPQGQVNLSAELAPGQPNSKAFMRAWNDEQALSLAGAAASRIMDKHSIRGAHVHEGLAATVASLARHTAESIPALSGNGAVLATERAISKVLRDPKNGVTIDTLFDPEDPGKPSRAMAMQLASQGHIAMMEGGLNTRNVKKAALIDDLEALAKAAFGAELGEEFNAAMHPRAPSGSDQGGEFVQGSGGHGAGGHGNLGGRLAGEGMEAGGKIAANSARAAAGSVQAWNHPVRLGTELGGNLGAEAGLRLVGSLLPTPVRTIGKIGALAAEGLTAMVGNVAGSMGGEAAGNAALRAGGHRAVGYNGPELGGAEEVGSNVGAMAGGLFGNSAVKTVASLAAKTGLRAVLPTAAELGGAAFGRAVGGAVGFLGGPVGSVLLGTAAGYAGDYAGRAIGRWFDGHDSDKAAATVAKYSRAR